MSSGYRHISLEPGTAQEKYLGWRLLREGPGLKVITQRRGPIRRCLLLVAGLADEEVGEIVLRERLLDFRTDLILHDYEDQGREARKIAGRVWKRAGADLRLLNIATFVFDLQRDDDSLRAAMSADYRRKLRKANEARMEVVEDSVPTPAVFEEFMGNFEAMAKERGLGAFPRSVAQRMFDAGDLSLFRVLAEDGTRTAATVYRAGDKAIFMTGVGGEKKNDGSGQLLHFEIMRTLRARGVRWYDFGGLPTIDENNGIYRFKKGFGGELALLGAEYVHRPPMVAALALLKSRLSRGSETPKCRPASSSK
ncbi:MAG TPA: GNAT family N-acetyltransferase [Methylocystis sp.]|nr:GNAT family N-acetyltransferase [Methylocystis sp.]